MKAPSQNRRGWGFTLTETMVTLGVMSILLGIAASNWGPMKQRSLQRSEARTLMQMLEQARMRALATGVRAGVEYRALDHRLNVFTDNPESTQAAPTALPFDGGVQRIFEARDYARGQAGAVTILQTIGDDGQPQTQDFQVIFDASGFPFVFLGPNLEPRSFDSLRPKQRWTVGSGNQAGLFEVQLESDGKVAIP